MTNFVKDLKKSEIEDLFEYIVRSCYPDVDTNTVDVQINPFLNPNSGDGFTVSCTENGVDVLFCKVDNNGLSIEVTDSYVKNNLDATIEEKVATAQISNIENLVRDEIYMFFIEEFGIYYTKEEEIFFKQKLAKSVEETTFAIMKYKKTFKDAGLQVPEEMEKIFVKMADETFASTLKAEKTHKEHMEDLFKRTLLVNP